SARKHRDRLAADSIAEVTEGETSPAFTGESALFVIDRGLLRAEGVERTCRRRVSGRYERRQEADEQQHQRREPVGGRIERAHAHEQGPQAPREGRSERDADDRSGNRQSSTALYDFSQDVGTQGPQRQPYAYFARTLRDIVRDD